MKPLPRGIVVLIQRATLAAGITLLAASCSMVGWAESSGSESNGIDDVLLPSNDTQRGVSRWFTPCERDDTVRFRTGFDAAMTLRPLAARQAAVFEGDSGMMPCTAAKMSSSGARFGRAEIQFQGGKEEDRWARIVAAPDDPNNRVLVFGLRRPNVAGKLWGTSKGRVQMNIYGNTGIRRLNMTVRMYLSPDFNVVRSFPGQVEWLTLSEWWNNAGWTGEAFPFRISVNLVREQPGADAPLHFRAHGQGLNVRTKFWSDVVWKETGRSFVVPVGRWVTLEYEFVEGDAKTGRFFLAATVDGGKRTTVFDVRNFTHHPDDPNPNGLSDFNPVKLYTSGQLVEYVHSRGGALQIYWDDLDIVGR